MELRPLHKKESSLTKKIIPILVGLFIIAVMVLSVLEFGNNNNEETIEYKDYKFTKVNDRWITYMDSSRIALLYNPNQVEGINADANYNNLLLNSKNYLSFSQEEPSLFLPANELLVNKNLLGLTSQLIASCPVDTKECQAKNLPVKTCSDATISAGVIILERANETSMSFGNNCLTLKGSQEGITKTITKLVLKRLGIL